MALARSRARRVGRVPGLGNYHPGMGEAEELERLEESLWRTDTRFVGQGYVGLVATVSQDGSQPRSLTAAARRAGERLQAPTLERGSADRADAAHLISQSGRAAGYWTRCSRSPRPPTWRSVCGAWSAP